MADQADLRAKIVAIQMDPNLTDAEKSKKRQELLCGNWGPKTDQVSKENVPGADNIKKPESSNSLLDDETLKCTICMNLCDRPVTAPCQHNFCLKCFQKWVAQTKKTCPTCRAGFPASFAQNPRINTALAGAIRLAKAGVKTDAPKVYARINNETRPDEAFTTDRAVRAGRANAASGRIRVTTPNDHFGPIPAEHDPERGRGVKVGDWWLDRLDCRQWGAHFPHVAGIAGQSSVGAQSVVLSGGYEDDRDEGEWFLYTGSGGRDLSGNKRVNKVQSFDQTFENMNKALKESCVKGYPVRVVRSKKEKRSAYAPPEETPVRYDGVYRILRCWRKKGNQGPLICRFLFVRCDNEPAPWSSGESGDEPRMEIPPEAAKEIKEAVGAVVAMRADPSWDFDSVMQEWAWAKPPPPSQASNHGPADPARQARKKASEQERLLKEFACAICKGILVEPLSTPCGHSFCKGCIEKKFEGMGDIVVPSARSLRVRKVSKPCPCCKADICDFLSKAQVNRDVVAIIQKLQESAAAAREAAKAAATTDGPVEEGAEDEEADEGEEDGEEAEEELQGDQGGASTSAPAATEPPAKIAASPAAALPLKEKKGKYADEMAVLRAEFDGFDDSLLMGMLEDQGGDLLEVRLYLKKIQTQQNRPKPKGKKAAAAAQEPGPSSACEAAEEDEAPQEQAQGSGKSKPKSKKVPAKAATDKAAAAEADDTAAEPMPETADVEPQTKPTGKATAAAKKAAAKAASKEDAAVAPEAAQASVAVTAEVEPDTKAGGKAKAAPAKRKAAAKAEQPGEEPAEAEAEAVSKPAVPRKRKAPAKAGATDEEQPGEAPLPATEPSHEDAGPQEEAMPDAAAGDQDAKPKTSGKGSAAARKPKAPTKAEEAQDAPQAAAATEEPAAEAAAEVKAGSKPVPAARKRKAAAKPETVEYAAGEDVSEEPVEEGEDFQPMKKARAGASGKRANAETK